MTDSPITIDAGNGKSSELPRLSGTHGPDVADVQGAREGHGPVHLRPRFRHPPRAARARSPTSTATRACCSTRGYPIEQLAEHSSYLEVCYLLMYGELPNAEAEAGTSSDIITEHTMVHENIRRFMKGFRYDAHPMAMLVGTVGAMGSFYHDSTDVTNPQHREISAQRLIAKMPTLAAYCYKHYLGQPFMYPDNSLGYVENFVRMMFAVPAEEYELDPVAVKAIELIMILHADHEQNASTSTVRLAGSSGANPFASISAGIACLWGPAHGGANESVINMLDRIISAGETIEQTIARAKDKNDPFRLMGFGHRVYKNFDPRAKLIQKMCHELLEQLDGDQPLFELAMELEKATLADEFFIERKLYPNVDFYSGIILRALKIPMSMFTAMFAISRTVGWISHWMEMHEDPEFRIGRPRQIYTGAARRDYPEAGSSRSS